MYAVVALLAVMLLLLLLRGAPRPPAAPADGRPEAVEVVEVVPPRLPYAPVGTLADGDQRVLQLFARPCDHHRDRWHYHTAVDQARIPVELAFRGRRCQTDGIGCERAYTGDVMTATEFGTSAPLTVQMYGE